MSRTLAWFQLGHTNGPLSNRTVGAPELQPGGDGWFAYVERYVAPLVGRYPIALWMPHGAQPGEDLDFDGAVEARTQAPHLLKGFVEAWKPITARTEVIAYTGSLVTDVNFRASVKPVAWTRRAVDSLAPYIESGMSLAFDVMGVAADIPETARAVAFVKLMRAQGVKSYIEPSWAESATWCHDMPAIIAEAWYRTLMDQGWPAKWRRLDGNHPEFIRYLNTPPQGQPDWSTVTAPDVRAWIAGVHADGHSAAVGADWLGEA